MNQYDNEFLNKIFEKLPSILTILIDYDNGNEKKLEVDKKEYLNKANNIENTFLQIFEEKYLSYYSIIKAKPWRVQEAFLHSLPKY